VDIGRPPRGALIKYFTDVCWSVGPMLGTGS